MEILADTFRPNFIVGIGGSAGALQVYKALLDALPADTGMAFVIVSHMLPKAESMLAEILALRTTMPVAQASDGMRIRPNHVYVIAPNTDLAIEDVVFKVVSPRTMGLGRHKQIDFFLKSLSEAWGPKSISIILSGYDGDGTEGCKAIKARGGTTFTQDLGAEVDSMPLHAQASGCVDFVVSAEKIAEHLTAMGNLTEEGRRKA